MLALHMRAINLFHPLSLLLLKFKVKKPSTRRVFADLFAQQSDLSLQLGKLVAARTCALAARELAPLKEGTAFIQATTLLCSINIFLNNINESDRLYSIIQEYESHNMEQSFSFRYLHLAVKALSYGNIEAARLLLTKASTTGLVFKDFTPLRFAMENISRWLNLITGEKELKFSDISIEDSELRDIWMLQGNTFESIFKGNFSEAESALKLLKEQQRDQNGSLYYSALLGYFGVRFQHHTSHNNYLRDECVNAVILGGRKLCERPQTTPIGIVCLFLSAFDALTIMLPPPENAEGRGRRRHRSHGGPGDEEPAAPRHRGGGEMHRLRHIVKSSLPAITALSKQFPFLILLEETLSMLQSCIYMIPLKYLHANECRVRSNSPIALFHEFTLGCAFWYEARERYCATFGAEGDLKEEMFGYIDKKRSYYKAKLGCTN